jgi:hypothetical protein
LLKVKETAVGKPTRQPNNGRRQRQGQGKSKHQAAKLQRYKNKHRHSRWIDYGMGGLALVVLIAVMIGLFGGSGSSNQTQATLSVGSHVPVSSDMTFTNLSNKQIPIDSVLNKPTLVWFMDTWCSSCSQGTQYMASSLISELQGAGIQVVELENYKNLGHSGTGIPSMVSFIHTNAGLKANKPDWIFGTANKSLAYAWNPKAYPDVYYLLNKQGVVTYMNSSPASTAGQLLVAVHAL